MPLKPLKIAVLAGGVALLASTALVQLPALGAGTPDVKAQANATSVPVKATAIVKKDFPIEVKAIGTVVPAQTVNVKSRIDSMLMDVKFRDGDNVKVGDVLFVLDDRGLKAQLEQARADLSAAQAQLDNARKRYTSNQVLIKQQAISQRTFDDSKTAVETQDAAVAAAKAAIQNIQVQLDYTTIRAPISGRTGTINVTVGNTVKANDTVSLVTINQISPIQMQMALPQDYFDAVRDAMASGSVDVVAVRNSDAKNAVKGTVSYLNNTIDQATGTFNARAVFPNENERLWPGMLANATIQVGHDRLALVVPEVAIQNSPTGKFIYIVQSGKAKKTPVSVDRIQDGYAVLASGVNGDEQVIVDGIMALKDDIGVTIVPDVHKP